MEISPKNYNADGFKDKLLSSLDEHLGELRQKSHNFVTDDIETKKDISHLGLSDKQLKKVNRVSNFLVLQIKLI